MGGENGTRRVVLLFAVLAGLFLMHGLNAPAMHGMPMPMPMPMPMQAPSAPAQMSAQMSAQLSAPLSDSAAMAPRAQAPTVISSAGAMPDSMQASMSCIPLRPEGMASLFLALFLLVITQWRPRLSLPARPMQSHWPHGPPRTGAQILRTLSISRT